MLNCKRSSTKAIASSFIGSEKSNFTWQTFVFQYLQTRYSNLFSVTTDWKLPIQIKSQIPVIDPRGTVLPEVSAQLEK